MNYPHPKSGSTTRVPPLHNIYVYVYMCMRGEGRKFLKRPANKVYIASRIPKMSRIFKRSFVKSKMERRIPNEEIHLQMPIPRGGSWWNFLENNRHGGTLL